MFVLMHILCPSHYWLTRGWAVRGWLPAWTEISRFALIFRLNLLPNVTRLRIHGTSLWRLYMSFVLCCVATEKCFYVFILCTHKSGRIYGVDLVIWVLAANWCYTRTIDCHTSSTSWSIKGIIDIKMIAVSVSIEDGCYCVWKPENKYTHFRKSCSVLSTLFDAVIKNCETWSSWMELRTFW